MGTVWCFAIWYLETWKSSRNRWYGFVWDALCWFKGNFLMKICWQDQNDTILRNGSMKDGLITLLLSCIGQSIQLDNLLNLFSTGGTIKIMKAGSSYQDFMPLEYSNMSKTGPQKKSQIKLILFVRLIWQQLQVQFTIVCKHTRKMLKEDLPKTSKG